MFKNIYIYIISIKTWDNLLLFEHYGAFYAKHLICVSLSLKLLNPHEVCPSALSFQMQTDVNGLCQGRRARVLSQHHLASGPCSFLLFSIVHLLNDP